MAATCVPKLYRSVIDDVISSVREHFLDEGVDEQILQELKQVWEKKVLESKAVEPRKPEQVVEQHVLPVQAQTLQPMSHITQSAQQITLPSGSIQQTYPFNSDIIHAGQKSMTITLPAQGGHGPLQTVLSAPSAAATLALPPEIVTASLFPHALRQGAMLNSAQVLQSDHTARIQYQPMNADFSKQQQFAMAIGQPPVSSQSIPKQPSGIIQLDGSNDTSDDDDDDDSHDEIQDDEEEQIEDDENEEEEEPLNSDDDVSDEDATELFYTDNVVVCQYDKVTRTRNRWKFHLKDGIMNLKGKDYVFQKANGDAEW